MLSTREKRHSKTKDAILQAARQLIAEKGPDGLSLRELARRIDYSPSGLYEYFPSKDEIVTAVCVEGFSLLRDYLNSVPDTLPAGQRLFEMGLAYLDFAREHPEHYRLIFGNLSNEQSLRVMEELGESPYEILLEAVQATIDAGEFMPRIGFERDEIAFSLWAMVHGMAMLEQTYLRHVQADLTPLFKQTFEVFGQGLKPKNFSPNVS